MNKLNYALELFDNCLTVFGLTIVTGIAYKIYDSINTKNNEELKEFQPEYKITLPPKHKYTREEIVDLGRTAIRDKNTGEILTNPFVNEKGESYQKKQKSFFGINYINIDENTQYKNRTLKNIIDIYKDDPNII